MPIPGELVPLVAGETVTLTNPAQGGGNLRANAISIVNGSPFELIVKGSGGGGTLGAVDAFTRSTIELSGDDQELEVTALNLTDSAASSGTALLPLWYVGGEQPPANAVPVTAGQLVQVISPSGETVAVSGTVNLEAGAEVTIVGTPTVDIAGTVDANISAGTVDVQNVEGGVLVSEATSPQQLLASEAATSTSVSIDLPTNCETIAILVPSSAWSGTITVKGNTTGMSYPVGSVQALAGGDVFEVANVFPAVDAAVTITLSSAPGVAWYVTSDSVVRYSFGAVAGGGSPLATSPGKRSLDGRRP